MKTLVQHNRDMRELREMMQRSANASGVACDRCGTEMVFRNPGMLNMSNPPSRWVDCPKCGLDGLMS